MTKNDLPINTMKTKEHVRHKKKIVMKSGAQVETFHQI